MPRTGTHSLKLALEQLLGGPCYHMWEVFQHLEQVPAWVAAAHGDMPVWDELLAGYVATVDFPAAAFWPELMEAYPDALVLLSTRDTESWWQSARQTIVPRVRQELEPPASDMIEAVWAARFTSDIHEEVAAKAAYEAFNDRVRAGVPSDRLLEWRLGDGWEPLCSALGVQTPDNPFPHTNRTADFLREKVGPDNV
jgi:hypothetical protein